MHRLCRAQRPRLPGYPTGTPSRLHRRTCSEPIKYGDDISAAAEHAIGDEMGSHYFITDWPTEIRPYYAMPYEDDPSICKAFDLMHPRMELSSGAERIHQYDLLVQQIKKKGLNPEASSSTCARSGTGCPPTRDGASVPNG